MSKKNSKEKKAFPKKRCPIFNMSPKLILIHSFSFLLFLAILTLCLFTISSLNERNKELEDKITGSNLTIDYLEMEKESNEQFWASWNCNDPYNISGESRFDTVVTGYITIKTIEASEMNPEFQRAYLVITDFEQEGFQKGIRDLIEEDHHLNLYEDGQYLFNLGCFKDGEIKSDQTYGYLDEETNEAIVLSTPENFVRVRLYFEIRPGFGCMCCSQAEKIRLEKE